MIHVAVCLYHMSVNQAFSSFFLLLLLFVFCSWFELLMVFFQFLFYFLFCCCCFLLLLCLCVLFRVSSCIIIFLHTIMSSLSLQHIPFKHVVRYKNGNKRGKKMHFEKKIERKISQCFILCLFTASWYQTKRMEIKRKENLFFSNKK